MDNSNRNHISEELEDLYVKVVKEVIDAICNNDEELNMYLDASVDGCYQDGKRLRQDQRITEAFKRKIKLLQRFRDAKRKENKRLELIP